MEQAAATQDLPLSPEEKEVDKVEEAPLVEVKSDAEVTEAAPPAANPGADAPSSEPAASNIAEDASPLEPVKIYSIEQRAAVTGEPRCFVCGRYGEYISDETDADVCSIECKRVDLERFRSSKGAGVPASAQTTFLYREPDDVRQAADEYITFIRHVFQIDTASGAAVPRPIWEFSQCGFPSFLEANLASAGFVSPTPVQMQAIPTILCDMDALVSSPTGSGKTGAFVIPLVAQLSADPVQLRSNVRVLVITPRRELCIQVEEQFKALMRGHPVMRTALIIGGLPLPNQLHRLRRRPQVVVATPGRLVEIVDRQDGALDLSCLNAVVIDEIDEIIKGGFEHAMEVIMSYVPRDARRILASATISSDTAKVAKRMMRGDGTKAARISVGERVGAPPAAVRQTILWVEEVSKRKQLMQLLQSKNVKFPAIIFVQSKLGAQFLSEAIKVKTGIESTFIHGDRPQTERLAALTDFTQGRVPIIVSTGVLSRGVDIEGVKVVILFDMPLSVDEYIHQVGRAGRLGATGWAYSFINNENKSIFPELLDRLKALPAGQVTPLPSELLNSSLVRDRKRPKMDSR